MRVRAKLSMIRHTPKVIFVSSLNKQKKKRDLNAATYHDVVGLDVPVNYAMRVQMLHGEADLRDEVLSHVLGKPLHRA